jgi:hypothetical protein
MEKFVLSKDHLQKRAEKKRFVLRLDVFGTFLQREMNTEDYFAFTSQFPDEADKVILDAMYSGDWYSVYPSEVLPLRHNVFLDKWRSSGIDIFEEWVRIIKKERKKECWLSHRIAEVDLEKDKNPITVKDEHPEWFIPAFPGHKLNNLAVKEIREHKVKVLGEVMRKYDFDGLDIDFERHTPILTAGRQWELREHVTEFMRMLRAETLQIAKEQNRIVMLSARVPDCLKGCKEDGLDIWTWIKEDLVDCLTLGSRSFDVKVEEFRELSNEIQLYGCYDPHHTVDGYTFPSLEIIRGIAYSYLQRGADAMEYFNWTGEGKKELVSYYVEKYGMDKALNGFVEWSNDDFTGMNDREFLSKQDKTYVIDRKGGYPWGIGYGNLNADRQLPCVIEKEGEVHLYIAENAGEAKSATLKLLFEELTETPKIYLNGKELFYTAKPHRDLQVTTEQEAPTSGTTISHRLLQGIDMSKPCTLLTADITGMETKVGYNTVRVVAKNSVRLEKVELEIRK